MGRGSNCSNNFYCNCKKHRKNREALGDVSSSGRSATETVGLVGEALIAGASLYGQATTPPEQPNTSQLSDSQSSQHERWRNTTGEASNQQSRPGTNQPK